MIQTAHTAFKTKQFARADRRQGWAKPGMRSCESDICDLFISPAMRQAGWDTLRQICREVTLTPGPVVVRGNMPSRN